MTSKGKLSKRDMATLDKAWEILSRWSEKAEENNETDTYLYDMAMSAVAGLCEFINEYKEA